jgi:hypothetical protein
MLIRSATGMIRSAMGRNLYRGHLGGVGVKKDIAVILDHNYPLDYRIRSRNVSNSAAIPPLGISRRSFLGGVGGTFGSLMLPTKARTAGSAAKRLTAETRMLEVNGRTARVFGLTGPDGRPGLRLTSANGSGSTLQMKRANARSSIGTASCRPGCRMDSPGRKLRQSRTVL